jgi:hypothetical protein
MSTIPEFSEIVIRHLTDTDSSRIHLNWEFFREFVKYPRVIGHILSLPVGHSLIAISNSDSPPILKKFFEFVIDLWTSQPVDVIEKFCDVSLPALGRLTCILKTRKSMFKDDDKLCQLIETFGKTILELAPPGAHKFIEAFARHFESGDANDAEKLVREVKATRIRRDTQKILQATFDKDLPS